MSKMPTRTYLALAAAVLLSIACNRTDNSSAAMQETAHFKLQTEPTGTYEKDKSGLALVRLTPKGGFKINNEYPFRFECQSPPSDGISYPKPTLQSSDGKLSDHEALFSVPFIPSKSGALKVGGLLSLSVCNDQQCIMDKRTVSIDITVP